MTPRNIVIHVKSHFVELSHAAANEKPTGEYKRSLFGKRKEVTEMVIEEVFDGYSEEAIDGERLERDCSEEIKRLNEEGYEVISMTPVISGSNLMHEYDPSSINGGPRRMIAAGGISFTSGMMIVGKYVGT